MFHLCKYKLQNCVSILVVYATVSVGVNCDVAICSHAYLLAMKVPVWVALPGGNAVETISVCPAVQSSSWSGFLIFQTSLSPFQLPTQPEAMLANLSSRPSSLRGLLESKSNMKTGQITTGEGAAPVQQEIGIARNPAYTYCIVCSDVI